MYRLDKFLLQYKKLGYAYAVKRFSGFVSNIDQDFTDFLKTIPLECNVGSINLEKDNTRNIAIVSIDNPGSLNAMTGKMMKQLYDVTEQLSEWKEGKAVILKGENNQFCTGGDLRNLVNYLNTPELGYLMSCFMHKVLKNFYMLPMPTLALIQGHALGGGAEITTACDYRVMCEKSAFGFIHSRLGVTPGFGGATRLAEIVGKRNTIELLISGKKLNASEAMKMGLIDDTLSSAENDALEWSIEWLERKGLLNLSPSMTQGITRTIKQMNEDANMTKSYEIERALFKSVWQSEQHKDVLDKMEKQRSLKKEE